MTLQTFRAYCAPVPRSHQQVEHTADLALELRGADEADLLHAGLDAVVEILTAGAKLEAHDERSVALSGLDSADRLVRWLNEILYMASVEGFVAVEASLELDGSSLRAVVRGVAGAQDYLRTEIKSATYHDLALRQDDRGWVAIVVLDV